jgi:hypothetical protein
MVCSALVVFFFCKRDDKISKFLAKRYTSSNIILNAFKASLLYQAEEFRFCMLILSDEQLKRDLFYVDTRLF